MKRRIYQPDGVYTDEEIGEMSNPTKEEQKSLAYQKLNESDYKVIKCMEYFLAGKELPYDIMELHIERQEKRDLINTEELV